MTTHEYLQKLGIEPDSCIRLAFMVGEVIEDSGITKRVVYHSTPVHNVSDWKRSEVMDYVILNTEVHDLNWLSGANWNPAIENHYQMMILVMSREELEKYYSKKQVMETEEYITKKILEDIESGRNPWIGKKY